LSGAVVGHQSRHSSCGTTAQSFVEEYLSIVVHKLDVANGTNGGLIVESKAQEGDESPP